MNYTPQVVFAGTSEFAATALTAIYEAAFPVPLVLTQPDRPAGRGMRLKASPVKRYAQQRDLVIAQPPSLRRNGKFPAEATAAINLLCATPHDVMVVAAYGLLLPQEVINIAPHGSINIHASLLPRWRGAAPIHRAIEAGDTETGITLMQMDADLDTGAMICQERTAIGSTDTTAILHDRLAKIGAKLIIDTLAELKRNGNLIATPQPNDGAIYAQKISKHEAMLDWRRPAVVLAHQIRAFNPFPGSSASLANGIPLKIWAAESIDTPIQNNMQPGQIIAVCSDSIFVVCGEGTLRVTQLQKPGGRRLTVREFLTSTPLATGQPFALSEVSLDK